MAETMRDKLIALIQEVRDRGLAEKDLKQVKLWEGVENALWPAVEAAQKVEVNQ